MFGRNNAYFGAHCYITLPPEKRKLGALSFWFDLADGSDGASRVEADVPAFSPGSHLVLARHMGVEVWHPYDVPVLYFHRDRRWLLCPFGPQGSDVGRCWWRLDRDGRG